MKIPIIDSYGRIQRIIDLKVDAFTVGEAIMDRKFVPDESMSEQVSAVLEKTGEAS